MLILGAEDHDEQRRSRQRGHSLRRDGDQGQDGTLKCYSGDNLQQVRGWVSRPSKKT